jgi:hypothetical protein
MAQVNSPSAMSELRVSYLTQSTIQRLMFALFSTIQASTKFTFVTNQATSM